MLDRRIELKNRKIVDIERHPAFPVNAFGVSLTTDEAQTFLKDDLRVFGDKDGPYLVVRLGTNFRTFPTVIDRDNVEVVVRLRRWVLKEQTGTICWLETII